MKRWYIYKTPKKSGDEPVRVLNYPPLDYLIEQLAIKYGPIVVEEKETNGK